MLGTAIGQREAEAANGSPGLPAIGPLSGFTGRRRWRARAVLALSVAALCWAIPHGFCLADTRQEKLAVVAAQFDRVADPTLRLDLAYVGLDLYAGVEKKSSIAPGQRDSLCAMKRVVIMDLLRRGLSSSEAVVTGIGSTGAWLLDPGRIDNDYDAADQAAIALRKHDGCYMEGLSDLDFVIMGPEAIEVKGRFAEILRQGRMGVDLRPDEVRRLEINFLDDAQIRHLRADGHPRRFWREMLDVEQSSPDAEKYVTRGGKALYCMEHLGERGAVLLGGRDPAPLRFDQWARSAGHTIGPFTVRYLFGGCSDMDAFLRHAIENTTQERIKTVLQAVKYLQRDAWMLRRAKANADKLPAGVTIDPRLVENLDATAERIQRFCSRAIAGQVWSGDLDDFFGQAAELSADVCWQSHDLLLTLGHGLLDAVRQGDSLDEARARMLDDIVFDLRRVRDMRFPGSDRPCWYARDSVLGETDRFLAAYASLRPIPSQIEVAGGEMPRDEPEPEVLQTGPVPAPPVATVRIDEISVGASVDVAEDGSKATSVVGGQPIGVSVRCRLDHLLDEPLVDPADSWTPEQRDAMRDIAYWSWRAKVLRMQIRHLIYLDLQNAKPETKGRRVYVSPYEIGGLAEGASQEDADSPVAGGPGDDVLHEPTLVERLRECEAFVSAASEQLGKASPKLDAGFYAPGMRPAPTLASAADYLEATADTCEEALSALETMREWCDPEGDFARMAGDLARTSRHGKRGTDLEQGLCQAFSQANRHIKTTRSLLGELQKHAKTAQEIQQAFTEGVDAKQLAAKASELEEYLTRLSHQAELATLDALATQNRLASGIQLFRECRVTVDAKNPALQGLHAGLSKSIAEWDGKKNRLILHEIPKLQKRALWLKRGRWAATSARVALEAINVIGEYREAQAKLAKTNLNARLENTALALKVCGDLIGKGAKAVPLPVLRQAVQDYAELLKLAPEWTVAFDRLASLRTQDIIDDVFMTDPPAAYQALLAAHPELTRDSGNCYRYRGPLAEYSGDLIVLAHAVPEPTDRSRHRMWLIWNKHAADGYLLLDRERYRAASLYAAWYRRVYETPITELQLRDLIETGKCTRQYVFEVTAGQLRRDAHAILEVEAWQNYIAAVTGRHDFERSEILHAMNLLHAAADRLAEAGFLLRDADVREILAAVRPDTSIRGTWATVLEYVPLVAYAERGSALALRAWHALTVGEQAALEAALTRLLDAKKQARVEAARASLEAAQRSTPAGVTLDAVRVKVDHALFANESQPRPEAEVIAPTEKEFTVRWTMTIPAQAEGPAEYACRASIDGYDGAGDDASEPLIVLADDEAGAAADNVGPATVEGGPTPQGVMPNPPFEPLSLPPPFVPPPGTKEEYAPARYEVRVRYVLDGKTIFRRHYRTTDGERVVEGGKQRVLKYEECCTEPTYRQYFDFDGKFQRIHYDTGYFLSRYPNGQKESEGYTTESTKWETEWYDDGTLKREEKDDGKHRWVKTYHPTGAPAEETFYKYVPEEGCVEHGPRCHWDDEGRKRSEKSFALGKQDGVATVWYPDGSRSSQEVYRDGELTLRRGFTRDKLAWEKAYQRGKLHGTSRAWYPNGQLKSEETFREGARWGDCKQWREDGALVFHVVYEENRIVRTHVKNGKPVE